MRGWRRRPVRHERPHRPAASRGERAEQAASRCGAASSTSRSGASRAVLRALENVSFEVRRGETLGIVGESGCGKSTLARCLVRLHEPGGGRIRFDGQDVLALAGRRPPPLSPPRPDGVPGSLQLAQSAHDRGPGAGGGASDSTICARPRRPRRASPSCSISCGLPAAAAERYPREFSGGQRQRIGIARALAVEPDMLIADEIVSALDVSVQAQIINLLLDLQSRLASDDPLHRPRPARGPAYLPSRRRHVSRLASSRSARPSSCSPGRPIPTRPALLAAAPEMDPARRGTRDAIAGELPSPFDVPTGCAFRTRCNRASDRCAAIRPPLANTGDGRMVACHHPIA